MGDVNMKKKFGWRAVVITICFVGIGVFVYLIGDQGSKFDAQEAKMNKEIATLKADIKKMDIKKNEDISKMDNLFKDSKVIGDKVAEIQNKYYNVSGEKQFTMLANQMMKYVLVKDWDVKGAWFPFHNKDIKNPTYKWEFFNTYDFNSDALHVVWINKEVKTGEIVAYATGVYDGKSKVFTNIKLDKTTYGQETLNIDNPERNQTKEIKGYQESIKKYLDKNEEKGLSKKEQNDLKQAQQKLKEKLEKEGK